MKEKRIGISETLFRDAHQSLLATRLRIEDMLDIAELVDQVGYHSLEVWGGATFDSCMRFLNEDPWDRLRTLRKNLPNTKLQMLLRGQNLVGYRQYPDDVVDEFVAKSIENGIDIIRVFDALNDIRNLERAIKATKKAGGHLQAAIVYTTSPVHNIEGYLKLAKEFVELGADSICIKDMAGILTPQVAYDLVSQLKANIDLPVQVHSHYTVGFASMTYWAAIQAGADVIDTALSPLALGTSQPPTETMVAALQGTPFDSKLDLALLTKISEIMNKRLADYKKPAIKVEPEVILSQIPGGMLSNLKSQLEQQNLSDRYDEILVEVPKVRKDLGYPPLVTPMSQIVGTQSLLNVVTGKRYSVKSKEIKDYVKGLYGRSPIEIDPEIRKELIGDEEPLTQRPADLLEPALEKAREEIKDLMIQEEDVLSYILFPEVAKKFFADRKK
ncbi:MAG: oxaloacetate decarboxylase subunit alpha [Firmicutes bacterium]|nr:oxaloacetate decarboxylase subunit alpha [Bacillota bacterium]